MSEKKSFKLKEIAELQGFDYRNFKHLYRSGIVRNYEQYRQQDESRKWVRLSAEEAILLSYGGFFFQDMRIVEAARWAAGKAIKIIPTLFFEQSPGVRAIPWLVLFEQYSVESLSDSAFEFLNANAVTAYPIAEPFPYVALKVGDRLVYMSNENVLPENHVFRFYAVTDLFFKFMQNLKLELTDIDPSALWKLVTPGINYPGRTRLEFQREFYRFVDQDFEAVLKYLNAGKAA